MKGANDSSKIKAAPHRKAIQEAGKIAAATAQKPALSSNPLVNAHTSNNKNNTMDSLANTTGAIALDGNEDYETCKVNKSKKAQYDADVRMVQDLDRWG